ncbi:hypothetical protein PCIT_a1662 [Pseudoalteromonas citrea]|uniref:O-antigen ligase domain-containing protein n=2 Tax=Pseudoalteromonas citrea TaxID=43655 RepID=A0AAD4AMP5_9GAMM|nr:O-antigen ligase family protein [Pseudoalteromonas citrea]KAF7775465.1 hypothetical protein PCIT_a1662 [Pseudoalteromonas citrea]
MLKSLILREEQPGTLHVLICYAMSLYLLADIASGFTVLQLGIDLKISLLYKLPLFCTLLLLLLTLNAKYFLYMMVLFFVLTLSPTIQLLSRTDAALFIADFSRATKLLMPMSVFLYFGLMAQRWPQFSEYWIKRILLCNFTILCFNLIIGLLGFGRPSYVLGEDETAGSNGFIYAANELGATIVVLFCFALHMCWNHYKRWYWLAAILSLFAGITVATKTAMLASFLIVFIIPLANERERFFKFTKLKAAIFIPASTVLTIVIIMIADLLKSIGLYERVMWVFNQKGIVGIIWSDREKFAKDILEVYFNSLEFWQQIIGVGSSGIAVYIPRKYAAEIDLIDTLMWFGFFGAFLCLFFYISIFVKAAINFRNATCLYSPAVLVGSFILLMLSQLSGHIWISGTLGISLGAFASLLWLDERREVSQ